MMLFTLASIDRYDWPTFLKEKIANNPAFGDKGEASSFVN